jgi:drug/metabolite transporter (DMT)-like permease
MTDKSPDTSTDALSAPASHSWLAYGVMVFSVLCLSSNHVIGRFVHAELPPAGLSFWRWFISAFILVPFVWKRRHASLPVIRKNFPFLIGLGALIVVSTTFILIALHFTTAINVSVINATQPSLTALLVAILFRDHLGKIQILGIAAALVGVLFMVSKGSWSVLAGMQFNLGDLIALTAMFGFSFYSISVRRIPSGLTVVESLVAINLLGSLALLPFYLLETAIYKPMPVSFLSFWAVLGLALIVSILAMLSWNQGHKMIGAKRAAVFINLMPVFGAILAVTFLGERLYAYHLVGALLIAAGLFMVLRWHKAEEGK